ncbi:hypothetical protein ACVWXO_004675 [Bradyrhizobium sp. LM2.7]
MSKPAKRGKAETLALPMVARVAIGAVAVAVVGYSFAVSPGERATDTEAVRAPSPGVVNSGLCGNSGSCIRASSDSGRGASGRTAKSR